MQTTIAYKKHSVGILYIVLTVAGLFCFLYGLIDGDHFTWIPGAVLMIVSGVLSVQYLILPSDIIALSEDNSLILPKGEVIPMEAVNDVSYRRAHGRGIQYRWGSITLATRYGVYKIGFVADCEDVAKTLTRMMYAAKHKDQS